MELSSKKILTISFSVLARDPRVYRQINFLKDTCQMSAAGLSDHGISGVDFFRIDRASTNLLRKIRNGTRLKIGRYEPFYWSSKMVRSAREILKDKQFDLIICNDCVTLPLSIYLAARQGGKVLLDAHEYEPRHFDDRLRFNFFYRKYWDYICREYLPRTDGMVTVCQGIANEYHKEYGVDCGVLNNAPFYEELEPSPVEDDRIRLVYHGGVNRSRRIDYQIRLMDHLDERFTLELFLVNLNPKYFRKFWAMAQGHKRIQVHEAIPMPEIAGTINKYDIGLYPLPPASFNQRMALPNKIFEFIQARLAVAIWPSPEMARVVNQSRCGIVADEFTLEALAEKLNSLNREEIMSLKQNSHKAAKVYCAQSNQKVLLNVVRHILEEKT